MKVAICAANYVGKELSSFIVEQEHNIEFAITCSDDEYEEEIFKTFSDHQIKCYRNISVNDDKFFNLLKDNSIDLVLLLWWPKIVKEHIIKAAKIGFLNLHPSLLPYNRGKHPYYWSIIEDTPAGVSIHFINPGIDDGKVLFQKPIDTDITTTGEILYTKSIEAIIELFKDNYENIISGHLNPIEQDSDISTFHWGKDIWEHSKIDLSKKYTALELLNIIRARTFSGDNSAFFVYKNEKYNVKIEISKRDD